MTRLLLSLAVLGGLLALAAAPRTAADEKKDAKKEEKKDDGTDADKLPKVTDKPGNYKGWVRLFNGKDLKGWKTHPKDKAKWEVKDGILHGTGEAGHLFSERGDYQDFNYRVEAKISDGGNSGQYFRTEFGPAFPKGYEAQINSTHRDPQKTGTLYNFVKVTEQLVPPDTWFTQEVIVRGNHIVIKVNGNKVVDFVDEKNTYTKGHFAIQQHDPGSHVQIRKIEVMEVPPAKGKK